MVVLARRTAAPDVGRIFESLLMEFPHQGLGWKWSRRSSRVGVIVATAKRCTTTRYREFVVYSSMPYIQPPRRFKLGADAAGSCDRRFDTGEERYYCSMRCLINQVIYLFCAFLFSQFVPRVTRGLLLFARSLD